LRLARGAVEGSIEATDQVLRAPSVVVVVDGYNVSMQGWPALDASAQRERLVAQLSEVANRTGAEVHAVFDGDDDGRRPAVSTALVVRVHFTAAGVEADDVVLDMVDRLPSERPVVVVSSDRRVQSGARERGANVVPSEALLSWARR
jgi:predicted RNA-binding protein with PIN domain